MIHNKRIQHFRRPDDAPFTAAERGDVTVLLGGLTWKHESLIQAVMQNCGYLCEHLPQPDREAHEIGKEYCGNNLCNPVYFTVGSLIKRLRELEKSGMSSAEIIRRYLFFTAGSGGPCRYGMYEAEFRTALAAAGFPGFRVLLFVQEQGVKASSSEPGIVFSADFNMGTFHAFLLGDLLHDMHRKLRAYESRPGQADAIVAEVVRHLADYFRNATHFDLAESAPKWLRGPLRRHRQAATFRWTNTTCKILTHLYGSSLKNELAECRKIISTMSVNRLQVKPMVKVIGEFWAQLTEGDGNFRIFEFLEDEGAEVSVEPISTWVMYLLHQGKQRLEVARRLVTHEHPWSSPLRAGKARLGNAGKRAAFSLGESIYRDRYSTLAQWLGGFTVPLTSQEKLAEVAHPHYSSMLRGGEGHLEVAKSLYYTRNRKCHMVLSVKPFGCLPSMQSDAVQASLMEKTPEMIFLSVETSGDGEIHAHSRTQMALADAKNKARQEFAEALAASHHALEEICSFVEDRPWLCNPLYSFPRRPGIISTAANFVLHVDGLMESSSDTRSTRTVQNQHSSRRAALAVMPSRQETNNV